MCLCAPDVQEGYTVRQLLTMPRSYRASKQVAWVTYIHGIQISLSASETCAVKSTGQCKQLA
jgi:hypothetical protein